MLLDYEGFPMTEQLNLVLEHYINFETEKDNPNALDMISLG